MKNRLGTKGMNWGRAVLISLPFAVLTMFWQAYDYIVPLMLSKHYHLGITMYSVIMSADNLAALIFLPLFGTLSDKISGRLGRRSPLILIGTAGGAAGLLCMSLEDAKATAGVVRIVPFLLFLLITVFFMSLYRSPSAALVADCFIRPQRTMANAVLNLMAGIGAVLFGAAGSRLIITQGDIPVFTKCLWFVFLSMLIATAIYFLFVRENRFVREVEMKNQELGLIDERTDRSDKSRTRLTKSERRSLLLILCAVLFVYMGYNGFHTHYTNYLITYLKQPASWTGPYLTEVGVGMLMMIPAAFITAGLGRKKSCLLGLALCVTGFFGLSTVTSVHPERIYIWFLIAAAGFPLFAINLGPMTMELAKDSESGRFLGYYYMAMTVAQIVTPALASLFIKQHGYGIIGLYGAVCMAVAFAAMLTVRHGDVKTDFLRALSDSTAVDD